MVCRRGGGGFLFQDVRGLSIAIDASGSLVTALDDFLYDKLMPNGWTFDEAFYKVVDAFREEAWRQALNCFRIPRAHGWTTMAEQDAPEKRRRNRRRVSRAGGSLRTASSVVAGAKREH